MNADLLKKAAEKVGNPNILVNLVSKRVRQLNAAGGSGSRPLVIETVGMGTGDVALLEMVDGKMDWEMLDTGPYEPPGKRKRKG